MSDRNTSTVHIPRDLHRQAKIIAAQQDKPVEQVYAELVREWLEKQPKEGSRQIQN